MLVTTLRAVAALGFALAPAAAAAAGVAFTVPPHYVSKNPGDIGGMPVYRVWSRADRPSHTITVTSGGTPDLVQQVDSAEIGARESGAKDVVRTNAAPLCGAPSIELSYARTGQRTTSRYVVAAGRLLAATYDRPSGGADDPSALAALSTLCSGLYQSAGPTGWSIAAGSPPNAGMWRSPDGKESFSESVRAAAADADGAPQPYAGGGAVTSDERTACGTIAYRRVTKRHGALVGEHTAATMGGYSYAFAYLRPAGRTANAGALAVLTGFCDGT